VEHCLAKHRSSGALQRFHVKRPRIHAPLAIFNRFSLLRRRSLLRPGPNQKKAAQGLGDGNCILPSPMR